VIRIARSGFRAFKDRNLVARLIVHLCTGEVLVIRRKVTRMKSYTVFMLPGYNEEWPTSEYEHQEILRLFKQDQPYDGIHNDFSDYRIGPKKSARS